MKKYISLASLVVIISLGLFSQASAQTPFAPNSYAEAYIDSFDNHLITGWAYDNDQPVTITVVLENLRQPNDLVTVQASPNTQRADVGTYLSNKYRIGGILVNLGFSIDLNNKLNLSGRYHIKSAMYNGKSFGTSSPMGYEIIGSGYASGVLVNHKGTVYLIMGNQRIPFSNAEAFLGLGYSFQNVIDGDVDKESLIQKPAINTSQQAHVSGSWVSNFKTIYYVSDGGLIGVPTFDVFLNNGGVPHYVVAANSFDLAILAARGTQPVMVNNDARVTFSGIGFYDIAQ